MTKLTGIKQMSVFCFVVKGEKGNVFGVLGFTWYLNESK